MGKVDGKIDESLKLAGDLDLWLRFFRYDKLYVTGALIGGFRQRASNQLSLDRMEEYIFEANIKIKEEKIIMGDDDKKIILFYNLLSRLSNYFDSIKVVNTSFILRWFEKKYFGYPDKVNFDRLTQKFFI